MKTEKITARLTKEQFRWVQMKSVEKDVSVSTFVRWCINSYMESDKKIKEGKKNEFI